MIHSQSLSVPINSGVSLLRAEKEKQNLQKYGRKIPKGLAAKIEKIKCVLKIFKKHLILHIIKDTENYDSNLFIKGKI